MKTAAHLICLLAFTSVNAMALPQNFSYGKYITPVEDQLRQTPCGSFAAVGGVELYYNLSYSGPSPSIKLDLSEREAYVCGGGDNPPARSLNEALDYIHSRGVIPYSCYEMPDKNKVGCTSNSDLSQEQVVFEKDRDCPHEQEQCKDFRIKANSLEITDLMTSTNSIKEALLEYGPIMLHFYSSAVHNTDHSYVLYGWETENGETMWQLRDSWPCSPNDNLESNVNLAAIFSDNIDTNNEQAHVITSVTRENWTGSGWATESRNINPYELEQGRQSARIEPPADSCLNRGRYSVTGLPAGSSVIDWSVRAYPDYTQISGNGVLSGHGTDVTVVATIQHSNGLKENITLPVGNVGAGHKMEKTNDWCPTSNQREFALRLRNKPLSGYSYNYSIDIPASPDNSYYVINSSSKTAWVVSEKAQAIDYSTSVEVVKNGDPSCSTIQTVDHYVISMPCSYY